MSVRNAVGGPLGRRWEGGCEWIACFNVAMENKTLKRCFMLASVRRVRRSYVLCRGCKDHERMNPDQLGSNQVRGKALFGCPHRLGGNTKVIVGAG